MHVAPVVPTGVRAFGPPTFQTRKDIFSLSLKCCRFSRVCGSLLTRRDALLCRLSERTKTEKISDQYISKAAEDFISRTRKLETDFARY